MCGCLKRKLQSYTKPKNREIGKSMSTAGDYNTYCTVTLMKLLCLLKPVSWYVKYVHFMS